MKHKIYLGGWWFKVSLILISLVFLAALPFLTATVRADPGLPPRETPTLNPGDNDKDRGGPLVGAHIELVAPDVPAGAWIVVQWQDNTGGWHNVEGWRGWVANSSCWWVHPKDFGKGPFRWVVFEPGGAIGAVSSSFNLPGQPNETLQVEASK